MKTNKSVPITKLKQIETFLGANDAIVIIKQVIQYKNNWIEFMLETPPGSSLIVYYYILFSATGFGDPHIITLDGVTYTFNGYGEYTLLRVNTTDFTLQARMQPLVRSNGALDRATVYTAFAMKENGSDVVQVSQ